MNTLTKQDCEKIDKAFEQLKRRPNDISLTRDIGTIISKATGKNVVVKIINMSSDSDSQSFLMSITPDESTIDKIMYCLINDDSKDLISSAWEACNNWTIEIDRRILVDANANFLPRELTALLMHEVQHMLYSVSTRNRICNVFKMCFVKQSIEIKNVLKNGMFSKLNLPILNNLFTVAISIPANAKDLKKELDADKFAVKMGYRNELKSVIAKLLKYNKIDNNTYTDLNNDPHYDETEQMFSYTADTIKQLTKRNAALARRNYSVLSSTNESVQNSLNLVMEQILPDIVEQKNNMSRHYDYLYETLDKIRYNTYNSDYFLEGVFTKKLKRIDPYDLSYIDIQISSARTDEDRILISAFLNSKLDLVEYYISLLDSNDKRYVVPHTKEELLRMRDRLLNSEKMLVQKDTKLKPASALDYIPQAFLQY